jgi:hypothetical protein
LGILEFLAKKNPDRIVFASVPALTKMCNGKYRNGVTAGETKPYKQRMVETCLHIIRDHKIVSERKLMTYDLGDGVTREGMGFVVNPHESMTKRYRTACHVIGIGKGPGTFVGETWVQDVTFGQHFGIVVENEISGAVSDPENAVPIAVSGAVPIAVSIAVSGAVLGVVMNQPK